MKNGREMVTSQKTKNLSNLEKKVKSRVDNHDNNLVIMLMILLMMMIMIE